MGRVVRRFPGATVGLLLILALGAASPTVAAPATPVASPQPEVAALLVRALATMGAVRSFRFTLDYERGSTTLYHRIRMRRAHGAVQRPDRFTATIEAKLGPVGVGVEVISVGQRVWVQLAGVNGEVSLDQDVMRLLLDPTTLLIGAVETIEGPTVLGEDQIDGVAVTRIAGTVEAARLDAAAARSLLTNTAPLPVELAIDAQGHLVSLRLAGPLVSADSHDAVRRLDLTAFDQPVQIGAPGG